MFRMTTTSDGEGEGRGTEPNGAPTVQCICRFGSLVACCCLAVGWGPRDPRELTGRLPPRGKRNRGRGCDVMELENRNKNNDDRRGTGTTPPRGGEGPGDQQVP